MQAVAQESGSDESQQADESDQEQSSEETDGSPERSDRMEFDARLIRGERTSGAVFLFQRTPRELPSMVDRRKSYLQDSVRSVLGEKWAERFAEQRSANTDETDGQADDSDQQ
jgi:hypothetical protein